MTKLFTDICRSVRSYEKCCCRYTYRDHAISRPSYFWCIVRVWTDIIFCVQPSGKQSRWKSDTRVQIMYVEKISNGYADLIRGQVGLPKLSIAAHVTRLNFSLFPPLTPLLRFSKTNTVLPMYIVGKVFFDFCSL